MKLDIEFDTAVFSLELSKMLFELSLGCDLIERNDSSCYLCFNPYVDFQSSYIYFGDFTFASLKILSFEFSFLPSSLSSLSS